MQTKKPHLSVRPQGRVYVTIIGVVLGMLVAGLGIPLALGRVPENGAGNSTLSAGVGPTFAPTDVSTGGVPTVGPSARPGGGGSTGSTGSAGTTGAGRSAGGTGTGGSTGPTSGGLRLTASDQGVTATTVKLGVVLLDIQALQPLGFAVPHYSPQEQQQQYQAFIDDVNKHGGLLGRRIVPVYETFNALDSNGSGSAGAVCRRLAEDDKVFAGVGILGSGISDCLSIQYHIPSITDGAALSESITKSNYLEISPMARYERGAANWGDMTFRAGLLNGHTSGTVFSDSPAESRPEGALVEALKADGYTVTYRAKFSNDQSTATSQLPVEVRKMQAAGVDTVFLSINFVGALQWVQAADQQNYHPRYMVSDVGALTGEGLVHNMSASFNGAWAFTGHSTILPEGPEDGACRTTFNSATGNHYAAGSESVGLRTFCGMIQEFAAGARAAGASLTRTGFAQAVQTLGTLSLPNVVRGTFGPGKSDFDDWQRPMRWSYACKCYQNAGPPMSNRY